MIELKDVSVAAGGQTILQDVSLSVAAGTACAVLGANGAGKSTLLGVMGGDLQPGRGRVLLNGRPVQEWPLDARAHVLGMLHQDTTLNFPFDAADVVLMGRTPHTDVAMHDNLAICDDVIRALELSELAARDITTLSGGERQRVQIARVLAQVWDRMSDCVLLLDEPTAALDLRFQDLVARRIREMADAGATVVAAVHDLNLAIRNADHVVLLAGGRVLAEGGPAEVMTEANVAAAYGLPVAVVDTPEHGRLVIPRG